MRGTSDVKLSFSSVEVELEMRLSSFELGVEMEVFILSGFNGVE